MEGVSIVRREQRESDRIRQQKGIRANAAFAYLLSYHPVGEMPFFSSVVKVHGYHVFLEPQLSVGRLLRQ